MDTLNKNIIANNNQFIYIDDAKERKETLTKVANLYLPVTNSKSPMAIYMDDFSLNKEENLLHGDNYMLSKIAGDHLDFTILYSIIERIINTSGLDISLEREEKLLKFMGKMSFDRDFKITSLEELSKYLKEAISYYKEYYDDSVKNEKTRFNILNLKIPKLSYESSIYKIKEMLNNSSYFALIFDKQKDVSLYTARNVNNLFLNRNRSDMVVKVACEKGTWPIYENQNGIKILDGVDYETLSEDKELALIKKI